MAIGGLFDEMTQAYGGDGPTQEDYDRAKQHCEFIDGTMLDLGWHDGPREYNLSKNPSIRELQIKSWAWSYKVARDKAREQGKTVDDTSKTQIEAVKYLGADATFEGWWMGHPQLVETSAIRQIKTTGPNRDIVLFGNTGVGKTMAVVLFVAQHMTYTNTHKGRIWNGMFIPASRLVDAMGTSGDKDLRNRLFSIRRLIIDDLKADETITKPYAKFFEELIYERYRLAKPTYITTNAKDLGQIHQVYGDRVMSRLRAGKHFTAIGEDMRTNVSV